MRIVSTTLNPVWKVAIPALLMPWDATSGEHLKQDCEDHGEDCYTDDVEQKVNHSCSLRRTVGTDTGKEGLWNRNRYQNQN